MTKHKQTVEYVAKSVLLSSSMWLNLASALLAVLSLTEVVDVIPPRYAMYQAAIVATLNMILRTYTVRPVAFVGRHKTKAVEVQKLPEPPEAKKS